MHDLTACSICINLSCIFIGRCVLRRYLCYSNHRHQRSDSAYRIPPNQWEDAVQIDVKCNRSMRGFVATDACVWRLDVLKKLPSGMHTVLLRTTYNMQALVSCGYASTCT